MASSFSLREFLFLPGGCAAARRLLAPARGAPRLLRLRPGSASRAGAPRCLPLRGITDTPAAIRTPGPRSRRRDGRWHPPGGLNTLRPTLCLGMREGGIQSAGAAGGKSLRSPRAPDARAVLGRRRRRLLRTPRGPGADRALRSRAKEPADAGRGGAPACRWPPRDRQQNKASRSEKTSRASVGDQATRWEAKTGKKGRRLAVQTKAAQRSQATTGAKQKGKALQNWKLGFMGAEPRVE